MKFTGYIYKITNDINDKVYIGKTVSTLTQRFLGHCHDAKKRTEEHRPLYAAMNKYGFEHFKIELVEEGLLEELSEREKYWIQYYNSYGKTGYNATRGGDGKVLLDYSAILDEFLSGKLVKELAEEFECSKDAITDILQKANINALEVSRQRIKEKYGQPVVCWDAKTYEKIKEFNTTGEAVEWLMKNGFTNAKDKTQITGNIGRVISQKRKTAFGFIWTAK